MTLLRSFALIFFISSFAFCFELKGVPEISPTAYLRWELRDGPIRISLDRRGSADLQLSQAEQALLGALNTWQNVSQQSMRFHYSGTASLQSSSGTDRINSIQWVESGWDYSSYALAVTSYSYYVDDPPTLVDADIFMNGQNYRWSVGPRDQNRIDVEQTLIHEVGHLLGISHSSVANAQMFPYISGLPNHKVSRDDKAALRFLYGTPDPSFGLVTPVSRARYVSNISAKGLPLPVFRWTPGPVASYVIEFSSAATFSKKTQFSVGPYPFYALTSQMEKKLLNLSPEDKIFWRVRSASSVTSTRSFRFINEKAL